MKVKNLHESGSAAATPQMRLLGILRKCGWVSPDPTSERRTEGKLVTGIPIRS